MKTIIHAPLAVTLAIFIARSANGAVPCDNIYCDRVPVRPTSGTIVAPNERLLFAVNLPSLTPQPSKGFCGLDQFSETAALGIGDLLPSIHRLDGTPIQIQWDQYPGFTGMYLGVPTAALPAPTELIVSDTWGFSCHSKLTDFCKYSCDESESCCDVAKGQLRELYRFSTRVEPDHDAPETPIFRTDCGGWVPEFESALADDVMEVRWWNSKASVLNRQYPQRRWVRARALLPGPSERILQDDFVLAVASEFDRPTDYQLVQTGDVLHVAAQAVDYAGNVGPLVERFLTFGECENGRALLHEDPPADTAARAGAPGAVDSTPGERDGKGCSCTVGATSRAPSVAALVVSTLMVTWLRRRRRNSGV